jgi:hypothetical protein
MKTTIIAQLLELLNPYFCLLLVWVGLESIFINAQLAYRKNHRRCEILARWGGYCALGLAVFAFGWTLFS